MIGAILGDIIGKTYEHHPIKTIEFEELFHPQYSRFSDDTVLTVAVADAILNKNGQEVPYEHYVHKIANVYPNAGYGGSFKKWMYSHPPKPYGSLGNGSAMRVSPIGWAYHHIDRVLEEAKNSADITHNHSEGVKGAQSVALAIFLARQGKSKAEIKEEITTRFGYNLNRTLDEIRPTYHFDVTCPGSVPESIIAFLESTDVESAIRLAISLGGDADTQAAIAGSIAEAFYQNDENAVRGLLEMVRTMMEKQYLDEFLHQVTTEFYEKYIPDSPVLPLLKSRKILGI